MGLLHKPIGVQTISLAAVEDIVVWILLAIASAFSSGGSALQGLYTLLLTLAFITIMMIIIRPIFKFIHGYYLRHNNDTNIYLVAGCFLLLVAASFATEVMGKYLRLVIHCVERAISTINSISSRKRRQIYAVCNVLALYIISYRYPCFFWCFYYWIMYTT